MTTNPVRANIALQNKNFYEYGSQECKIYTADYDTKPKFLTYENSHQIESPSRFIAADFSVISDLPVKKPESDLFNRGINLIARTYTPWNAQNDRPEKDSTQEMVYKVSSSKFCYGIIF